MEHRASAQLQPHVDPLAALPPTTTVATFSRGILAWKGLPAMLGADKVWLRPQDSDATHIDCVVVWGHKPNSRPAIEYARRHGLPLLRLEDGFLRSVGLGVNGAAPLSIVPDDVGIYYDATRPSRLERYLNAPAAGDPLEDPALLTRARDCIDRIIEAKLSKYNDSTTRAPQLPARTGAPRVLLVDQTAGDLSVTLGLASASVFDAMAQQALEDHPDAQILVKTHPDVLSGKKRGHLQHLHAHPRVHVITTSVNPITLLGQVDYVYTVTSQLGFEALMVGKPVACFGAPFYAGWGLTQDRVAVARRGRRRSLEQVFAAAYLLYARYLDPDTGVRCEMERVIEHLALQRKMFANNAGHWVCVGFSRWKHPHARVYLQGPDSQVSFARSVRHARRLVSSHDSRLIVWGARETAQLRQLSLDRQVPLWRMEDGFLRSVELGSNLTAPASLVIDQHGIYYDPSAPSDLERLLQNTNFSTVELAAARTLQQHIVSSRVSKYNLGSQRTIAVDAAPGQTVVLVPGQVEDDASIRLGCREVRTNEALLREVRRARPDAFVVFKPHPDVVSGNRKGAVAAVIARGLADEVVPEVQIADCLARADEVHTMTSLVGFEALLRGKVVVVYGLPFYAGWGLTQDRHHVTRGTILGRTRRLTLEALVAGTLSRYPRYVSRNARHFTTAEVVVEQLQQERDSLPQEQPIARNWPWRQLRRLGYAVKGITGAR